MRAPPVPWKVPVTIRVDADVAALFRAMGQRHLMRINAVLRAFMLARLAGIPTGPEAVDYAQTLEEEIGQVTRGRSASACGPRRRR